MTWYYHRWYPHKSQFIADLKVKKFLKSDNFCRSSARLKKKFHLNRRWLWGKRICLFSMMSWMICILSNSAFASLICMFVLFTNFSIFVLKVVFKSRKKIFLENCFCQQSVQIKLATALYYDKPVSWFWVQLWIVPWFDPILQRGIFKRCKKSCSWKLL